MKLNTTSIKRHITVLEISMSLPSPPNMPKLLREVRLSRSQRGDADMLHRLIVAITFSAWLCVRQHSISVELHEHVHDM